MKINFLLKKNLKFFREDKQSCWKYFPDAIERQGKN